MYRHPKIYNLILKFLHGNALDERFKIMAEEVGKNKKVLDVGCGPGNFAEYLDSTCDYSGIDLNEKFIAHAKEKGLNVKLGDLLDEKNYTNCDVTIICDILHHVVPDDKTVVEMCKKKSAKTIICEPFSEENFLNGILDKFRDNRLFHNLFGEGDGVNTYDDMKEWNAHGKDDVIELMENYGAKRTIVVGNDVIGIIDNN